MPGTGNMVQKQSDLTWLIPYLIVRNIHKEQPHDDSDPDQ